MIYEQKSKIKEKKSSKNCNKNSQNALGNLSLVNCDIISNILFREWKLII